MRRFVIILIAVLALAVVGAVLIVKAKENDKAVVFPNGVEVRVRGAFQGGKNVSSDKPWTAALRKILPARWHGKLPQVTSNTCGSGTTNQLIVFFELTTVPWEWIVAVDDDGFAYPRSGGSCSSGIGNGKMLYGVPLQAFPRRQKSFRLDFLDAQSRVLAQIRVTNPLPVPPVEQLWQAQALPITQTNGELALTLVFAQVQTNRWGSSFNPVWQKQAFDPHWEHARIGYSRVTDPVGNEGGVLSRKEKVWQVKASAHRTRLEDFTTEEKISVTNVAVPSVAQMIPLNAAAYCAGMKIVVEGLYGWGTVHVTDGLHLAFKRPAFLVEVTGMSGRDELVVRLTDVHGQVVSSDENHTYRYRGGSIVRVYQIGFGGIGGIVDPIDQVGSVSLEIAVSRPKEFVFYINPKDIQPPQ